MEETVIQPDVCEDQQNEYEIVGVRFKDAGKVYYFNPNGITLEAGDAAIVDTARGQEYGFVSVGNKIVSASEVVLPLRDVVRKATAEDEKHYLANKEKEKSAAVICLEKIAAHKLEMKLVDVEYTFDNSKLLFYFTADGRVDFRELVKDLAAVFK
ncbi:MAG: PSP1 domain-containing protein, partial [Clostridia bacterium]|nr:PSP1 domain-containing protein [Clostridia bacterium]